MWRIFHKDCRDDRPKNNFSFTGTQQGGKEGSVVPRPWIQVLRRRRRVSSGIAVR